MSILDVVQVLTADDCPGCGAVISLEFTGSGRVLVTCECGDVLAAA